MVPSCYNREAFDRHYLTSYKPTTEIKTDFAPGCPHWKTGGNAHKLDHLVDLGGRRLPWSACSGCRQKSE
jgi:hypothetical protein